MVLLTIKTIFMTSVFKKTSLVLLLAAASVFSVSAAGDKGKGKKHKCNTACKPGAHMYKHGEKGHKCSEACKNMGKTGSM